MLEQTWEASSPTPKQEENFMYTNNIRGTARPQSSDLHLREHLKPQYIEQ